MRLRLACARVIDADVPGDGVAAVVVAPRRGGGGPATSSASGEKSALAMQYWRSGRRLVSAALAILHGR